jgi:hypothetical protein
MHSCAACGCDCSEALNELSAYTLTRLDSGFIHQHVVDAYGAQHGGFQGSVRKAPTRSHIGVAFSLLGLYLACEKGYTGRQVQLAHIALGRWRKQYAQPEGSPARAALTVVDVMKIEPGVERDQMLKRWAAAVWEAWAPAHEWTRALWSEFERETRRK